MMIYEDICICFIPILKVFSSRMGIYDSERKEGRKTATAAVGRPWDTAGLGGGEVALLIIQKPGQWLLTKVDCVCRQVGL